MKANAGTELPGIALKVIVGGEVLYENAIGLTELEKGMRLSPTTNFRMASVSKQFTAFSIALLVNKGMLRFDDPIRKFFPELPSATEKIQIRHLITHSSGIIDYEEVMQDSVPHQLLDQDVLELLVRQDSTYFIPGSNFRYSNSGYAILSLLVERLSGQTFPQYVRQYIFNPLKMSESKVYESGTNISNRAYGYARDRSGQLYFRDQSSTSAVKGDGGVYTSLNDYHKWIGGLFSNKLLDFKKASAELNYPIKASTGSFYNLGWFYFEDSQPGFFHSGSTSGFSTFSIILPNTKTSVVYFSNIADNSAAFRKVLDCLQSEGITDPARIFELHNLTR